MDLLKASELSRDAYNDKLDKSITYKFFRDSETDAEMFIIILSDEEVILAFRGTESIHDWFFNIKASKVNLFENEEDEENLSIIPLSKIQVHNGFYQQYQGLFPEIIDYFDFNKDKLKKFYCIGHSLGGALANIACVDLKIRFKDLKCECYTFGAPRVGNSSFKKVFENVVEHSIRAVYDDDIVPKVPSYWRGYRHCGAEIKFNDFVQQKSYISRFISWLKPVSITDHIIDNYIEAVKENFYK